MNVASPFKALTPKGELLEIKEGKLMIELLSLSEGNIKNPPRWQPKDRGKRHVVMVVPTRKWRFVIVNKSVQLLKQPQS